MQLSIQHKQCSWIQTKHTGGQPYNDASPYELSERSLITAWKVVSGFDKEELSNESSPMDSFCIFSFFHTHKSCESISTVQIEQELC